ncbi:hypothetical protein LN650_21320 [Klebsiella pneumoniae subsp. pneumoniae]|nr:hypothetical protein [Klebsiella pneumoniae subsp. pneumoniae]
MPISCTCSRLSSTATAMRVAAEFRCRGDDLLGIYADAIREQVESMRDLEAAG